MVSFSRVILPFGGGPILHLPFLCTAEDPDAGGPNSSFSGGAKERPSRVLVNSPMAREILAGRPDCANVLAKATDLLRPTCHP